MAATAFGQGYYLEGPTSEEVYCDDALLPGEGDVFCGLAYRYTGGSLQMAFESETNQLIGQGNQREEVSWWPRPSLWAKLVGEVAWNPLVERIFKRRLEELNDGKAKPLNATQWRSIIRSPSFLRDEIGRAHV